MSVKFKFANGNDRRVVNNLAETKVSLRKEWYVVGTDGKKSYTTTIENAMLHEARVEADRWAKRNGLKVEVVRAVK
jgi:hypothetical protein